VVVVYKVDRLSRSLLDFARLMGVFEQRGVSFVSVTQDFNTNTSMGRLTLNILLSFAQFEKEIISERTRDKLGAARRKGKWIGGIPILGYDVDPGGGRLIVNEAEAERVREIFAIAAKGKSLDAIWEEVARRGIKTKQWASRGGRVHEGKPIEKSTLRAILSNVLYIGSIRHKGAIYPGEQPAIVDKQAWQKVKRRLEESGPGGRQHRRCRTWLGGLVECGHCGEKLVKLAATRHGRRYSYYGCGKAKRGGCVQMPVTTEDLDEAVRQRVGPRFALPLQSGSGLAEMVRRVRYQSGTRQVTVTMQDGSQQEFVLELSHRPGVKSQRGEGGRVPRVSRLMALAIKLEGLVASGEVKDRAELAKLGKISRARLSQILGLRNLALPIQEKLLLLPKVEKGSERIHEKNMRAIAQLVEWEEQERQFAALVERAAGDW
jgi:site-specific DNA recombinase